MRFFKILIPVFILVSVAYVLFQKHEDSVPGSSLSVVVTIKPIHSLVCGVARGVFEPTLLMDGAISPHTYSPAPNDVQALRAADLVIWVGSIYETHMQSTIEKTVPLPKIVTLSKGEGVTLYPPRKESYFEGEFEEAHHSHDHPSHGIDGHLWLSPDNAILFVQEIAKALSRADAFHAKQYEQNAAQVIKEIKALDEALQERLKPIRQKPYLLYHDSMQYFDKHFGTQAIGAITMEPGEPPRAQHFMRLKVLLSDKSAPFHPLCLFTEPQFENDMIVNLAEQFSIPYSMLDYLGQDVAPGPKAYFDIMNQLADCLLKGLS